MHVGGRDVDQQRLHALLRAQQLQLGPRRERFLDRRIELGRERHDRERVGGHDRRRRRAQHHRVQQRARAGHFVLGAQRFGARVLDIDLGAKHLELGRHAGGAPVARVVDVRLLRLHVRANDAELLDREQQLVVRANRVERRHLPCPLHVLIARHARDARRLERLSQLEAEERLPDVGRSSRRHCRAAARSASRNSGGNSSKFGLFNRPGSRERMANVFHVMSGSASAFASTMRPSRSATCSRLNFTVGFDRERLRDRVGARKRLRRGDAGERKNACEKNRVPFS